MAIGTNCCFLMILLRTSHARQEMASWSMSSEECKTMDSSRSSLSHADIPDRATWFKSPTSRPSPISVELLGHNLSMTTRWTSGRGASSTSIMMSFPTSTSITSPPVTQTTTPLQTTTRERTTSLNTPLLCLPPTTMRIFTSGDDVISSLYYASYLDLVN